MSTLQTTVNSTGSPQLPSWLTPALQQGLWSAQTAAASNPYDGLTHNTAFFTDGQNQNLANIQGIGSYQPQQTSAPMIGAGQVGHWDGIRPQSVGATTVGAGQVNQFAGGAGPGGLGIGGMDLSAYMNPYTQSVIDQSDKDIQRQSDITQQANNGRAAMSGAFGGDRAAIVNTETQRNAADTMARTNAGLRSQNFAQAQAAATGDVNRQLQAGTQQAQLGLTADSANQAAILRAVLANQQADLSAQTTNQASGQRADVANQQAMLTADKANQSASMQAQQGNQFAGLQGQNLNLSALNAAQTALGQQQATNQRFYDNQYTDQQNRALYPANSASYLLSQTQKLPYGSLTNTNNNSTTNAPGPSELGQWLSAGTAGAGILGSLFGSGSSSGSGFGSIGSGISSLGSGIGSAYNWLTGSGGSGASATDAFGGSGIGSSGVDLGGFGSGYGDAFGGSGVDTSSFDPFSGIGADGGTFSWGFARGGQVRGQDEPGLNVNLDGSYDDTYAPIYAGRGQDGTAYQGNLGIASLAAGANVPVPDGPDMGPPPAPAAAAPDVAPMRVGPDSANASDPSLPVPPIPPAGGPPVLPAPAGSAAPAGIASGLTVQPNPGPTPQQQGSRPLRDPNVLDGLNQGNNPLWMALIQGGAAGMASNSHTALGALGAALGAGAGSLQQQAQAQRQADAQRAQAESLNAYRAGQVANGQGRVQNGADANNIKADGQDQRQPLVDARIAKLNAEAQAAMTRAEKQPGMSSGQVMDTAARDLMNSNPGMTYADAVGHMKGLDLRARQADQGDRRVAQGDARLAQGDARAAATDDYRTQQAQFRATAAEDAAAKSVINAASQIGKTVTYADAVNQVRSTRQAVGPAPVPQATGTAALRQAAGSPQAVPGTQGAPVMGAAPVRVSSREQAMSLPPGAMFITPDGVTRQRPLQ